MGFLEVKATDTGIKLMGVRVFDLDAIFDCGQCFRWYKIEGKYVGVVGQNVIEVYKEEGVIYMNGIDVDDYLDYYQEYFDMDTNYVEIYRKLRQDPTFSANTPSTSGLRILKQELFETLVSFIISANNNIPRIKTCIDNLCSLYGDKLEYNGIEFHTFPTYEQLSKCKLTELKYAGLGYRAEYLMETLKLIGVLNESHGDWEEYIRGLDYKVAKRTLKNFRGVGDKVAECVCLFSLGHMEAFPIDTWIKKVLFKLYGIRVNEESRVNDFIQTRFGNLAGYAQQYLFYYKRGKI